MGLHVSSCGDDTLQFRRCLAASFFLNAALKQPEGTYRYYVFLVLQVFLSAKDSHVLIILFMFVALYSICIKASHV